MLDITKDIHSLTSFRRQSADFLNHIRKSKRPLVLTVKGKAAAILQDAESYQRLLDIAARADEDEGIRQGLDDIARGAPVRSAKRLTRFDESMLYSVELSQRAVRDLDHIYVTINAPNSKAAARWFHGLEDAISTLAQSPHRCPSAPDAANAKKNLGHLLYGRSLHVYRVIFAIDEAEKVVRVVHVRHGARRNAKPSGMK